MWSRRSSRKIQWFGLLLLTLTAILVSSIQAHHRERSEPDYIPPGSAEARNSDARDPIELHGEGEAGRPTLSQYEAATRIALGQIAHDTHELDQVPRAHSPNLRVEEANLGLGALPYELSTALASFEGDLEAIVREWLAVEFEPGIPWALADQKTLYIAELPRLEESKRTDLHKRGREKKPTSGANADKGVRNNNSKAKGKKPSKPEKQSETSQLPAKQSDAASPKGYQAKLLDKKVIFVKPVDYEPTGKMFNCPDGARVLRMCYRLTACLTIDPAIDETPIEPGNEPTGNDGIHAEHPIDRVLSARFVEAANSGVLKGETDHARHDDLRKVPNQFWLEEFQKPMQGLSAWPAVGYLDQPQGMTKSPDLGSQPNTPEARMMTAFGSKPYCYPMIPCQNTINEAKGRLMRKAKPVAPKRVRIAAKALMQSGTSQDADRLLDYYRLIFAVFEYLNANGVAVRFNAVREEVGIQLHHVDMTYKALKKSELQLSIWWEVFIEDHLKDVEKWVSNYMINVLELGVKILCASDAAHSPKSNSRTKRPAKSSPRIPLPKSDSPRLEPPAKPQESAVSTIVRAKQPAGGKDAAIESAPKSDAHAGTRERARGRVQPRAPVRGTRHKTSVSEGIAESSRTASGSLSPTRSRSKSRPPPGPGSKGTSSQPPQDQSRSPTSPTKPSEEPQQCPKGATGLSADTAGSDDLDVREATLKTVKEWLALVKGPNNPLKFPKYVKRPEEGDQTGSAAPKDDTDKKPPADPTSSAKPESQPGRSHPHEGPDKDPQKSPSDKPELRGRPHKGPTEGQSRKPETQAKPETAPKSPKSGTTGSQTGRDGPHVGGQPSKAATNVAESAHGSGSSSTDKRPTRASTRRKDDKKEAQ